MNQNRRYLKDSLGWGFLLWFIGYLIGFALFFVVPPAMIGWVMMPIGIALTLWVLLKKVKEDSLRYYVLLSVVWTLIAIAFDYLFLVKLLHPADGYYKLDVYIYYAVTFILPLCVGWRKQIRKK